MIDQLPEFVQMGFWVGLFLLYVECWMWVLAKLGMPFACYVDEVGGSS